MKTCINKRNINGVLLLDKPKGFSSNFILQKVKKLYQAKRAGHTGSLDPLATGILPICFGESTKFSQYFLNSDKVYCVLARLGQRTDTFDSDGIVLEEKPLNFSKRMLYDVLNSFHGKLSQIPPAFSAIKHRGVPMYKYARQGVQIPIEPRIIVIYKLKFIFWKNNFLKLEIHCSKGTYIRTIINDIGAKLGCGAHVTTLRRLKIGLYPIKKMINYKKLFYISDQCITNQFLRFQSLDFLLMPVDFPVSVFPKLNLKNQLAQLFKKGQSIKNYSNIATGFVRITEGKKNTFIGIAKIHADGYIVPKRLIKECFIE